MPVLSRNCDLFGSLSLSHLISEKEDFQPILLSWRAFIELGFQGTILCLFFKSEDLGKLLSSQIIQIGDSIRHFLSCRVEILALPQRALAAAKRLKFSTALSTATRFQGLSICMHVYSEL